MSWAALIGAGITAATGRRDNKQAAKAARREHDWEQGFAEQSNTWTKENQEDAQAFEAQQAASAMQFSERMANTQHQREIADLAAAGLNPILSGTGGMGAAAPQGVAGHSSGGAGAKGNAPKQTVFPTSQAIMAGAASGAQIELAMAQKDKTEAEADEIRARTPGHALSQEQTMRMTDKILADTEVSKALEGKTKQETKRIENEVKVEFEKIFKTYWEATKTESDVHTSRALEGLYKEQTGVQAVERRLQEMLEAEGINGILRAIPALAPILGPLLKKAPNIHLPARH